MTELDAQNLMIKLSDLRSKVKESSDPKLKSELAKHEQLCIESFKYLVLAKTSRYRSFSNYEDLTQEGLEALIMAMKTYDIKKGSFFAWAHHYIGTRISRSANLHTTIRYPLKVAKLNPPFKEHKLPFIYEERFCPEEQFEQAETAKLINDSISLLPQNHQQIIAMAFGLGGDKPASINKISRELNISRAHCFKIINNILSKMRDSIAL